MPTACIRSALVCLGVLWGAVASLAGPQASSLRVEVDGPVTSAAAVTITAIGHAGRYERPLDTTGRLAQVAPIPPGAYDVRVALADGRSVSVVVTVSLSQAATVVVRLPADGTSAPTLIGHTDVPIGEGVRFDRHTLDRLAPANDVWSLAETAAPFVIADRMDTGGLGTARSALLGARGESSALTTVDAAGMFVRAPGPTGQLPVAPPMLAAEAVAFTSGVAPAEVATPGVLVRWSPRRPTSAWTGLADVSATTPGMVGENPTRLAPAAQQVEDWREASATFGGPVAREVGLVASARSAVVSFLEEERLPALDARSTSLFTHLVARPMASSQFRLVGAIDRGRAPFDARHQFADTDVDEETSFARVAAIWDHSGRTGTRRSITLSLQRNAWRPQVTPTATGGVIERVRHGVVPAPPADLSHVQWDGGLDWGVFRRASGTSHDVRLGATVRQTRLAREIVALPTVAESVAGLAARVWTPVSPGAGSVRTATEVSWYVADRLGLGDSVALDLGLRGDLVSAEAESAAARIGWHTISPRVALRWQAGPLAVEAGAGRYAGGHPLAFLAYGDPGEPTWNVHRWHDRNADGRMSPGETGVLVARAGGGAGVGELDPDLRVPRTTEWTAGGQLRLGRYSTLRGSIVIRRQTDLVGVVNRGLGPGDYRVSFIPDINADEGSPHDDQLLPIYERLPSSFGRDALWLTNPDADPVQHDGIELTYELRSPRWLMIFGATAYRTLGRGGLLGYGPLENDALVLGDRYWNPNLSKDLAGRLFFDRAYVGKWVITYAAPGDVNLGAVVRYQDGQPFTRYVVASDLAGGPELTQAYSVGRTRFTYTATLDVRLEKVARLGARGRLAVRLDVFNLTNHANELAEDVLTGPAFRRSTITQPPRTLRAGLRVEF